MTDDELIAEGIVDYDPSKWRSRLQYLRGEEEDNQDGAVTGANLHLHSINQVLEPLMFKVNVPPIHANPSRAAELADCFMAMRDQARVVKRTEQGEEYVETVVNGGLTDLLSALNDTVRHEMKEQYEENWVLTPDTEPPRTEGACTFSINSVPNLMTASKLSSGRHAKLASECLLRVSVMRVTNLPPRQSYCHEAPEGYTIGRDEIFRLQSMSRRMPFDEVMANVAVAKPGKLYWTAECSYQQQCVRTESRDRSEPSFLTTMDLCIPASPTEAQGNVPEVIISLWDERGTVGRLGLQEEQKVGTAAVPYAHIAQLLQSPAVYMPDIIEFKKRDDGHRNASWHAVKGSYTRFTSDHQECWVLLMFELIFEGRERGAIDGRGDGEYTSGSMRSDLRGIRAGNRSQEEMSFARRHDYYSPRASVASRRSVREDGL